MADKLVPILVRKVPASLKKKLKGIANDEDKTLNAIYLEALERRAADERKG